MTPEPSQLSRRAAGSICRINQKQSTEHLSTAQVTQNNVSQSLSDDQFSQLYMNKGPVQLNPEKSGSIVRRPRSNSGARSFLYSPVASQAATFVRQVETKRLKEEPAIVVQNLTPRDFETTYLSTARSEEMPAPEPQRTYTLHSLC